MKFFHSSAKWFHGSSPKWCRFLVNPVHSIHSLWLISRKIWEIGKILNFPHCDRTSSHLIVYYGCDKLSRSSSWYTRQDTYLPIQQQGIHTTTVLPIRIICICTFFRASPRKVMLDRGKVLDTFPHSVWW